MEGFDNLNSILAGFNGLAERRAEAFASAAKSGDAEGAQAALDGILEAHRLKEDYTRDVARRVTAVAKMRLGGMPS